MNEITFVPKCIIYNDFLNKYLSTTINCSDIFHDKCLSKIGINNGNVMPNKEFKKIKINSF